LGFILTLFFILPSCAPKPQLIRESSSKIKPVWIEKPPQPQEFLYFVGLCSSCDSLQAAQESAIKDALSKISQFVGVQVRSLFQEETTELEKHLSRQLRSKSESNLLGVQLVDWYFEKTTRLDRNFSLEKYDVYVLTSYSKGSAWEERERQLKNKKSQSLSALELYGRGKRASLEGKVWLGIRMLKQASKILESVGEDVEFFEGQIKDTNELKSLLQNEIQKTMELLKGFTLSVKVSGLENGALAFNSSFMGALSPFGYVLQKENPSLEIVGEIYLMKGGLVLSNRVYTAEGNVSVQKKGDGKTIASAHVNAKGFHRELNQSALNALEEAGKSAAEALKDQLILHEQQFLEEANP